MLIAQITDCHINGDKAPIYGRVDPADMLDHVVEAVCDLPQPPDVVLATGDLVDSGAPDQYAAFRAIADRLTGRLLAIPGNHDERNAMRAAFPDHDHLPVDGFLHYAIEDYPVRLIGLDTVVPGAVGGAMCDARLDWLDARLAEAPDRPTIIFMHHPPFPTGLVYMDSFGCENGDRMQAIVRRYENVERVLCGHVHRPVQRRWAGTVGIVCAATCHHIPLDLAPDAPPGYTLEPPSFGLHAWNRAAGLVSHMSYAKPWEGPHSRGGST